MKLEHIYPPDSESDRKKAEFDDASLSERENIIGRDMERAMLENQKNFKELALENQDNQEKKDLYKKAFAISEKISENGGLALVVGGFARDSVMKSLSYDLDPKDIDIEVYGMEMLDLERILAEFGEVNAVGATFGVLKLGDLDISIPRRDSKKGEGHRGFEVKGDPKMLVREAAKRRDLTINALAMDPLTGEIIDAFGGIEDILGKKLRATDEETFKEDPLRVLRVMQFAGRFDFDVEENTKKICIELVRSGALGELPVERFEEEWKKLLLKSEKPSKGLQVARELEIISHYPELKALIDCPQEYEWHPEGDVWTHTLMVLDEAKKIADRENLENAQALVVLLSALCHDMGKPLTTEKKEINGVERITAYGHEEAGVEPARVFLKSINISADTIKEILPLVRHHLFPTTYSDKVGDSAIRRLAKNLAPSSIKSLVMLGEADVHGRGYWRDQPNAIEEAKEWTGYKSGQMLLEHAERLPDISATSAETIKYITGKTLIGLGLNPKAGKKFGGILKELEKAQEEDKITGPEDLKLAKLLVFLAKAADKQIEDQILLTGEPFSKEEMMAEVKDRIFEIGTHDMGTLLMNALLRGDNLPPVLEKNKLAILTAHKHGPAWFRHFDREFYDSSWKSFYGAFEVDLAKQKELASLDFEKQLQIGLDLVNNPHEEWIKKYNESYDIRPVESSGKLAYYNTNLYPFETGMMDGFEIMVQYIPEKKRMCISVMNDNPQKVKEIDQKIRDNFPEFRNARKVGYLFASNEAGEDNVFLEVDARRVYENILDLLS